MTAFNFHRQAQLPTIFYYVPTVINFNMVWYVFKFYYFKIYFSIFMFMHLCIAHIKINKKPNIEKILEIYKTYCFYNLIKLFNYNIHNIWIFRIVYNYFIYGYILKISIIPLIFIYLLTLNFYYHFLFIKFYKYIIHQYL